MINISFLLPVYNVKPYLEWCLNSIIKNINIDYEIICVDDCSTDGSYELLLLLQKKFKIKLFRNDINKGVSFTRNRLLDLSKGEYVWFVDPDDMICSNSTKVFYDLAKRENAQWVIGDNINIKESRQNIPEIKNHYESSFESFVNNNEVINCFSRDENGKECQGICFGIIEKKFLEENNIRFKENVIMGEDALFSYEMLLFFDKIIRVNIVCYYRRIRPGSACTAYNEVRNKAVFVSYLNLYYVIQNWIQNNHYNPPGKCSNKETLHIKLINTQENIVRCLAMVKDKKYVKNNLNLLIINGLYPYKDVKKYITRKKGIKGFLINHLNNKLFFWLVHFLYTFKEIK